ncbi:MAG: pitrilysin family protein [Candidatus Cloacimonadaceae bacterium]|nr:pitrilysin family protein [Candidatus Cloacimonadaceae bacterium]MDP3114654.1 pitrilysin family protein [Candidatus Cloacimonadaceae bacterium]
MTVTNISPARSAFLPNSLKYIIHNDNTNPLICLQIYIRIGSVKEKPAEAGFAHFIEHLAFKSTRDFPLNALSEHVTRLGGAINAYTDFDCTCYYLMMPSELLEEGLHILSQLAFQADFASDDVEIEKDIIIEEIKQYENEPEMEFFDYLQSTYFDKSPLKKPVLGTIESVKAADHKRLLAFQAKYYRPDNAFLVLSGDINGNADELIKHYFGNWKKPSKALILPDYSRFMEPETLKFRKFERRKKTDFIALLMPELCEAHPNSDALLVAMRYYAIGKASKLYKRLVEREKLCSSVKVSSLCGELSGASAILFTPSVKNRRDEIITIIREEFLDILAARVDPVEIELIKLDIIHSWLYGFESMENIANMIGAEEFIKGYENLYQYAEQITAVSFEEVIDSARKYWQPDNLAFYYQSFAAKQPTTVQNMTKRDFIAEPAEIAHDLTPRIPENEDADFHCLASAPSADFEQLDEIHFRMNLSNGLKIIYRHIPHKPMLGITLSTEVCQLKERSDQRGENFLTSTAMLYGTRAHSHEQIMQFSRRHGFNIRVIHHLDSTNYRAKCFNEDLGKTLDLLKEIIAQPLFNPHHVSMLKTAAIDSIRRENQYPVSYSYQRWLMMLFGTNSILDRSCGSIGSLGKLRLNDLRQWHLTHYHPAAFVLAVVGSLPPKDVFGVCASVFDQLESKADLIPNLPLPERKKSPEIRISRQKAEQSVIHLGGYGTAAKDVKQNTAFHLLAQILGGDISSRFFNILREKHAYAYQCGFDFSSIREIGFWNAYAFCDPDDYKDCLRLIREILTDVAENGVHSDELSSAQNYLIGMNRFDSESVSYQASAISNLLALGYDLDHFLFREQRLRSVSNDDIKNVASTWLKPDNHFIHIVL